ncbi:hypothetical protein JCM9492_16530 [Aquifex pyrophilus]
MRLLLLLLTFLFAFGGIAEKYKLYAEFLKTKDISLGEKLLKKYPDAPFRDELLYNLILIYHKKDGEKTRYFLKLLRPQNIYGEERLKFLRKLYKKYKISPKKLILSHPHLFLKELKNYKFTGEEKEKIAQKLFRRGLYREVLRLSGDCILKGRALYRLKKVREAINTLRKCENEKSKEILFYILLNQENYEEINKLVKTYPFLSFIAGKELLERGRVRESITFLKQSGDEEAKFYLGIAYYLLGRYRNAENYFLKYSPKREIDKAKRLFWLFKTYVNLEKVKEAYKYLEETSKYDNFYGAVARKILGMEVHKDIILTDIFPPSLYYELKKIYELGFLNYMRYEALKNIERVSRGDILLLQSLDPYISIRLAVNKYGTDSEIYRYVSHPTPYRELVREASERFGVPEALIYAIMRQESLFDPLAESYAGAKGLMQLMDYTARWKAKRLGIKVRNIFEPKVNVILGTAYLSYLRDLFGEDLVRIIAAYNAGHNAVKRWKRYEDDFLFIELIPYDQTKRYTKKVLYNYYVYSEKLE